MNLQGFIKQPRINGRQARWLIYLTPYDFIIRHRPGSLNPADGPSRRPDFPSRAREIPGLLQRDLLASKLVGTDSDLPETERPRDLARLQPCDSARMQPSQEQLCEAARTTQRVNNLSPLVDSKGQWALVEGAVGLRTPIATVQALYTSPIAEDSEACRLLKLVRLQAVTRRKARKATQGESPLMNETAPGLLDQVLQSQGTDPLCARLRKELASPEGPSREGYSLDPQGLLRYKGRAVVPCQRALIQELLYLYHDDQFAGH
jgi:hypothetical protein